MSVNCPDTKAYELISGSLAIWQFEPLFKNQGSVVIVVVRVGWRTLRKIICTDPDNVFLEHMMNKGLLTKMDECLDYDNLDFEGWTWYDDKFEANLVGTSPGLHVKIPTSYEL